MKNKPLILLGLLVVVVLSAGFFINKKGQNANVVLPNTQSLCGTGEGCAVSNDVTFGYQVGDTMPNIKLTDFNGNSVMLYDLIEGKEKFVLSLAVNWCGDCDRQNAKLNEYYAKLPASTGVAVVYINLSKEGPQRQASEQLAREHVTSNNYSFPTYFDYGDVLLKAVKPKHIPANFVLDENAVIKARTEEIDMDVLLQDNKETYSSEIVQQ